MEAGGSNLWAKCEGVIGTKLSSAGDLANLIFKCIQSPGVASGAFHSYFAAQIIQLELNSGVQPN